MCRPERAEPAGDQVAPIFARLQRIRHLEHDLADVPRLLHAPKRRLRLRQRIDLDRKRCRLTAGQPVGHDGHQVADALGFRCHQNVQRKDLVVDVGTDRRHLLRGPDVPLGNLDEPSVRCRRPHGGGHEPLTGETVEHHVDACTAGIGENAIGEVGAARVVYVFHAHRAQRRALVGACGGEDDRTALPGQLDRGQTDAAAGGMHEHPVTGPKLRPVERQ